MPDLSHSLATRFWILPVIPAMLTVVGCVSSRQSIDLECPDYAAINSRLERRSAFVHLDDYTRASARDVRMTADSTNWLRPDSTRAGAASASIVGIEVPNQRGLFRFLLPLLPGAAYLIQPSPWTVVAAFGLMVTGSVLSARQIESAWVYRRHECLEK